MRIAHKKNKPMQQSYYPLECSVQPYDWGNPRPDSIIKQMCPGSPPNQTTAELWMGAHKKAPSKLPDGTPLDQAIRNNPEHFLGPQLTALGQTELPYLFKILDAERCLSIQTHPDHQLAEKLHATQPEHYPDPHPKPELAISLGDMEALIGFRPREEIETFLSRLPELHPICSPDTPEKDRLKNQFSQLMRCSPAEITQAARLHQQNGIGADWSDEQKRAHQLFLTLTQQFGESDPGIFCVYFLNYLQLKHGEALFLGPGEPHAYVRGQIVECMTSSDNVIRAGLTPKYRDVNTLLNMLHFRTGQPQILRPTPVPNTDHTETYTIPAEEFEVYRITLPKGKTTHLQPKQGPVILTVLSGSFTMDINGANIPLKIGSVILFPGDRQQQPRISFTGISDAQAFLATVGAGMFFKYAA